MVWGHPLNTGYTWWEGEFMDEEKLGLECRNDVGLDIIFDFDFFICLCG